MNSFGALSTLFLVVILCSSWVACKKHQTARGNATAKPKPPRGGTVIISREEAKKHPKNSGRKANGQRSGTFVAPTYFDARTNWPSCLSIRTIRNQGACSTCWAVSAASVLSDRLCITRGQTDFVSATQIAGCSYSTRNGTENCVGGGDASVVYKQASLYGFASGGEFGSHAGCVPYSVDPNSGIASPITCATACTNTWPSNLTADTTARVVDSYWINYYANMSLQANIDANVRQMQEEIFYYGSITAAIHVYDDFQNWKPANGTYVPSPAARFTGLHGVRIIGWNWNQSDPHSDRYWLVANSWGTYFGDKGVWRVRMGNNTIGIESTISAPIVDISARIPCSSASFCSAPIDQAVKLLYNVSSSPAFLFQGDCKLQVAVNTTTHKLSAVGAAQPIAKLFLNVPTPVVAQIVYNGALNLLNAAGVGGSGCFLAPGTTKYQCGGDTWTIGASPFAITSTGVTYTYNWKVYPTWMLQGNQASLGFGGSWIGGLLTQGTNLTVATAFLNIDDTQMYVFGKGATGNPLTGIMKYPDSTGGFAWKTLPAAPSTLQTC